MARPGWPERNRAVRSFRQLRRFHHVINSDKVFGTHREALLTSLRALAFQRFSAHLAKSRDFQDTCARHLEFGTSHPRDYELLYGRGWMERVTTDAQGVEIERYTTHLVRAGVDESRAAHIAYPIMMMLHGVVMHRLLNKKPGPLGRAIAAACLEACMTLLESARRGK